MNPPLRRSRRSRTKSCVTYSVGDVVEIKQGTSTSQVKLLCKLTTSQASASESEHSSADVTAASYSKWLVAFVSEGGGTFGENGVELPEHLFGRIVRTCGTALATFKKRRTDPTEEKNSKGTPPLATTDMEPKGEAKLKSGDSCSNSITTVAVVSNESDAACSTETEPAEVASLAGITHTASRVTTAGLGRSSHANTSAALSAREERSRRRQAKIEEQQAVAATESLIKSSNDQEPSKPPAASRRARKRGAIDSTPIRTKTSAATPRKRKKTKSTPETEEEVVKINMNTGTLYLYRGLNRRAVFVRRV